MLIHAELDRTLDTIGNKDQFVSILTELFVEDLPPAPGERKISSQRGRKKINLYQTSNIIGSDLPTSHTKVHALAVNGVAPQRVPVGHKTRSPDDEDDPYQSVEGFIGNLSHYFNNLLMGIWGNASLITLRLAHDHPICARVTQMERLIQTGANLTHVIFGFLVERKMVTKRLRLVQLIHEINECMQSYGGHMDMEKIEASMQWATRIQSPAPIAGNIARVLEQLFEWIKDHFQAIVLEAKGQKGMSKRLAGIEGLLAKGFHMTQQLKLYAGETKPNPRNVNLKLLVERLARQTRREHKQIAVRCFLSKHLAAVRVDRSQISHVMEQIIDNAVRSMPGEGELTITVRPLMEESPRERCVVHTGRDYLVATIADTGPGMDIQRQARIFDPFFSTHRNKGRMGLGLASAAGIVRAHGGYIQVRSTPGTGTIFKVYLPTA